MRRVIVGQAPSLSRSGRAERRMADLLGLSTGELAEQYEWVNLLPDFPGRAPGGGDLFDEKAARAEADALRRRYPDAVFILMGRKVGEAFGYHGPFMVMWGQRTAGGWQVFHTVPHPSGVSRWWNDPENVRRARAYLRNVHLSPARFSVAHLA